MKESDAISRQAAIDNLERYRELFSWDDGDRERAILSRVIKELQSMPTTEKRGKWIDYCAGVECDQCGFECGDTYCLGEANFCPNCGARMEESE